MNWFSTYLGGCVGWMLCMLTSPDVRALHARNWHTASLRSPFWGPIVVVVSSLMGILIWPLMLIGWLVGVEELLRKQLDKVYLRTKITCPCGFQAEVSIPRNAQRWVEFPAGWYLNDQFEWACSVTCARHMEICLHQKVH